MGPPDPIVGLGGAFQADPAPNKVIVGVGAYRDDHGKPYVLPSVRRAEEKLLAQRLDMEYAPIVSPQERCRSIYYMIVPCLVTDYFSFLLTLFFFLDLLFWLFV
jgi:aspartate/tyrosine/aromatic aminotransferase